MAGEKILVTGANGCVGHALVKRLLESGFDVTALALDADDTAHLTDARLRLEFGDIRDPGRMREIFKATGFDVVIHLAALVHSPGAAIELYRPVNTDATATLYGLAQNTGVRQFIFISTVAVYGDWTEGVLDETSPTAPTTPYSQSKLEPEQLIRENFQKGLHYTIIRPTTVYGPHDRGNIRRLSRLVKLGIVPVPGNGQNLKSFVYTGHLAEGILKTVLNPVAFNDLFILSDARPYTLNEILRELAAAMGKRAWVIHLPKAPLLWLLDAGNRLFKWLAKKEPLPAQSLEKLSTSNVYSCQKAREKLGYDPNHPLVEGFKRSYLQEGDA